MKYNTPSQEVLNETSGFYAAYMRDRAVATTEQVLGFLAKEYQVDRKYIIKLNAEFGYEGMIERLERFHGRPRAEINAGDLKRIEFRPSLYDTDFDLEGSMYNDGVLGLSDVVVMAQMAPERAQTALEECIAELDAIAVH